VDQAAVAAEQKVSPGDHVAAEAMAIAGEAFAAAGTGTHVPVAMRTRVSLEKGTKRADVPTGPPDLAQRSVTRNGDWRSRLSRLNGNITIIKA
jgi:hypothetical protein